MTASAHDLAWSSFCVNGDIDRNTIFLYVMQRFCCQQQYICKRPKLASVWSCRHWTLLCDACIAGMQEGIVFNLINLVKANSPEVVFCTSYNMQSIWYIWWLATAMQFSCCSSCNMNNTVHPQPPQVKAQLLKAEKFLDEWRQVVSMLLWH